MTGMCPICNKRTYFYCDCGREDSDCYYYERCNARAHVAFECECGARLLGMRNEGDITDDGGFLHVIELAKHGYER